MRDYISDLRKIVGHIPINLSTAGAIILDNENKVLMQHRIDNDMWGLPGGVVELGESVEQAAKREVREETGLIVSNLELFNIYSGTNQHYIYPNGDEVYFICVVFLTQTYTGEVKKDENETKDIRFFDVDNLPDNISPSIKCMLDDLRDKIKTK